MSLYTGGKIGQLLTLVLGNQDTSQKPTQATLNDVTDLKLLDEKKCALFELDKKSKSNKKKKLCCDNCHSELTENECVATLSTRSYTLRRWCTDCYCKTPTLSLYK
jgi:hypothetical protein